MATNRSRFISSAYKIKLRQKNDRFHSTEHGRGNVNFADDEENIVDVDLDEFDENERGMDDLHVAFSQATSSVDINYPPNSTRLTEPVVIDENGQGSDEEVAANVSNTDDPSMLALTFRSWLLGLLFTCLLSFVNQFFWYRTSPLFVGTLVAQLLTYPLGKLMARVLPVRSFRIYRWSFTLNPGPFTIKEHCIITAMANATCVSNRIFLYAQKDIKVISCFFRVQRMLLM